MKTNVGIYHKVMRHHVKLCYIIEFFRAISIPYSPSKINTTSKVYPPTTANKVYITKSREGHKHFVFRSYCGGGREKRKGI